MTTVSTSKRPRAAEWIAYSALALVQVAVSVVALAALWFAILAYEGCGDLYGQSKCNIGLGYYGQLVGAIAVPVAAIAVVVLTIVSARRGRRVWWLPLAGTGLVVIALVGGLIAVGFATSVF